VLKGSAPRSCGSGLLANRGGSHEPSWSAFDFTLDCLRVSPEIVPVVAEHKCAVAQLDSWIIFAVLDDYPCTFLSSNSTN
jgi:hypothetical protein